MENLICIISFQFPQEAYLAKSYLESNGVEIFLQDEMMVQINQFYSNAVGGVKLLSRESDQEICIRLLKDAGYINSETKKQGAKIETIHIAATDSKTCPFCQSDNIYKNKRMSLLALPIYFTLGLIFPLPRISYKCFDCGREWKNKKQ